MILVNSAGNDGMGTWKKINVPADAHDILTVGAVSLDKVNAPFSSIGPTADGRIKPDVMAYGCPTNVVSGRGIYHTRQWNIVRLSTHSWYGSLFVAGMP